MKKLITTLTILVALNQAVAAAAFAETLKITKPSGALDNISQILSAGISLILIVAGLVAFVYLLLGGIKWITSGGDKGQVEAARNQIIQALIGLIVVFAAWGIIVLFQKLTGICLGFGTDCPITLPLFY